MPNFSGVTYYKLKSGFQGDITKNCSLTASEVDHNFLFLRGYDIIDFSWDRDTKELILERVNGEKLIVQGILNSIDASASSFDPTTGTLTLNIEGNEFPITGFSLEEDLDEIKRNIATLSGVVSTYDETIASLSGDVVDVQGQVGCIDVRVSANTDNIASTQTYINLLEEYPGVPTLPGLSCTVPDVLVYEVGENTIPRLDDAAVVVTPGKFDSKGTIEVIPGYTINYNPNFPIYINGVQYGRNSFPLTYNVPYGTTHMSYNPIMRYSKPSNLPLTNYDRETSKTGVTAAEGTAIWSDGIADVGELVTLIIGRYPCYTNINGDVLVPDIPSSKIDVTKGYVKDGWHIYGVNYPPNWNYGIKYEFYFPDVLELKSVMLDSGVFGKMEVNSETYIVESVAPIAGINYNRLRLNSVNNIDIMHYWFKLKEK